LSFVGSRDPEVRPVEYFTVTDTGQPSILRILADQGIRIRNWLGIANTQAQSRLDSTIAAVREQGRSLLTAYEPSVDQVMQHDGSPGGLSVNCLNRLNAAAAANQNLFARICDLGRKPASWRTVCERSDQSSFNL